LATEFSQRDTVLSHADSASHADSFLQFLHGDRVFCMATVHMVTEFLHGDRGLHHDKVFRTMTVLCTATKLSHGDRIFARRQCSHSDRVFAR